MQINNSDECRESSLHWHYSQVHSDLEWLDLLESYVGVKYICLRIISNR